MLIATIQELFPGSAHTLDLTPLRAYLKMRQHTAQLHIYDRVWHYTTPVGMLGIIDRSKLWASSIFHMNDKKEYIHSINWIQQAVHSIYNGRSKDKMTPLINSIITKLDFLDYPYIYIACFSASEDQLSQWRGYGDSENGFSIGFNSVALYHLAVQSNSAQTGSNFYFQRVLYGNWEKTPALKKLLDAVWHFYRLNKTSMKQSDAIETLSLLALSMISELAVCMKDEKFSEEKEWRLVCLHRLYSDGEPVTGDIPVRFRAGSYGLTPYIEIDLSSQIGMDKPIVTDLLLGPSPYQELNLSATRLFVKERGLPVNVKSSKIPLR